MYFIVLNYEYACKGTKRNIAYRIHILPAGQSDRSTKKGKPRVEVEETKDDEKKSVWVSTLPNGDRMQYKDNTAEELKPIMICLASDPETGQVCAFIFLDLGPGPIVQN